MDVYLFHTLQWDDDREWDTDYLHPNRPNSLSISIDYNLGQKAHRNGIILNVVYYSALLQNSLWD